MNRPQSAQINTDAGTRYFMSFLFLKAASSSRRRPEHMRYSQVKIILMTILTQRMNMELKLPSRFQ